MGGNSERIRFSEPDDLVCHAVLFYVRSEGGEKEEAEEVRKRR